MNVISCGVRDLGQPVSLESSESLLGPNAVPRRRREFVLGRECALKALGVLGYPGHLVGRHDDRSPQWPSGVVGSITHTEGYVAAIVAKQCAYTSLGLDVERIDAITPSIYHYIFCAEEREWLSNFRARQQKSLAAVIFSAKEAFFKAWYPVMGEILGFHDVHIGLIGNSVIATTVNRRGTAGHETSGRFCITEEIVVTTTQFIRREAEY